MAFEVKKAVRESTPLIIIVAGPSGSGKTVSAIRLGLGIARVRGGRVALLDTEGRRGLAYADLFDFDHIDFPPPFSPLRYKEGIQKAVESGAKVIVVDSATHEHNGEGGVMDQIDSFLNEKCGDDYGKREKLNMIAHARIKPQRKELNNYIVQLGRKGVVVILCYRANDKVKPVAGQGIKHMGLTPETTSPLLYEATQAFLLSPGADGRPVTKPETTEEKLLIKTPMQFRGWITGEQLDEALGEKLARWAAGSSVTAPSAQTAPAQSGFKLYLEAMAAQKSRNQEIYYRCLGIAGIEHANELRDKIRCKDLLDTVTSAIDEHEKKRN